MEMRVKRTFSAGATRFKYELMRYGRPVKKVLSDNEYLYAVVTDGNDPEMALRRDISDVSNSELLDPDTRILTIETATA